MHNSILFDLLGSFDKNEVKEFNDMVSSVYFNRKSAVTKLWKVIMKDIHSQKLKDADREKIYQKIFPGKKFNYGTFKNIVYDLTKLAEEYIEHKTYSRRSSQRALNLCEGLLERGLGKVFERSMAKAELNLEKNKSETGYHWNKYLAEVLKQNYMIQQDRHYQTAESIKAVNDNLTMGYFIDVIDNNYNWLFMQGEIKVKPENDFLKKFLDYYKSNPVKTDLTTRIYYYAFLLIYEDKPENFYKLRSLLQNNLESLSGEQKYNFFVALANFCLNKSDSGNREFARHEYEIYRFMIDNAVLSIDKVKNMDGAFYKNVAGSADNAGETSWAENFIEKYKNMLEPDLRENYYCHAMIEHTIKLKDFKRTMKYLSKIKHTNYVDKLNIKRWELITAFELGHFEEINYIIDSAKHFLQNDTKISDAKKKRFSSFVYLVNKLSGLRKNNKNYGGARKAIKNFSAEIQASDTPAKEWLLAKLTELSAL